MGIYAYPQYVDGKELVQATHWHWDTRGQWVAVDKARERAWWARPTRADRPRVSEYPIGQTPPHGTLLYVDETGVCRLRLAEDPYVAFAERVARLRKDGDVISDACVHCGFTGEDDLPDEGCVEDEHEYGELCSMSPLEAWERLTVLITEARVLMDWAPAAPDGGHAGVVRAGEPRAEPDGALW